MEHSTKAACREQSALVAMFACSRRKGVLCTGLALVIVLYHLTTQPTPHKKVFVLLVTGYRAGGESLGELFNANPAVQYHHEPFHPDTLYKLRNSGEIKGSTERSTLDELQLLWLEQVLSAHAEGPPGLERHREKGSSREQEFSSDVIVFKVTRLTRIESLLAIPNLSIYNLKIIHLVRDPRDVMQSQLQFSHFYYKARFPVSSGTEIEAKLSIAAQDYCTRVMDDVSFVQNRAPHWLQHRYMRISYGDLITHRSATAAALYSFLSLPLPKHVLHESKEEEQPLFERRPLEWDTTYQGLVEDECKELMREMGLSFTTIEL